MSIQALKIIKDDMKSLGISYEFGSWTKKVVYPYFTGEYQETPPANEDGMQETTFLLTGFTRGEWLELEEAKKIIKDHYRVGGNVVIAEDGSAVAIFYEQSLIVPTGDAELKRIQITLSIREWSVK